MTLTLELRGRVAKTDSFQSLDTQSPEALPFLGFSYLYIIIFTIYPPHPFHGCPLSSPILYPLNPFFLTSSVYNMYAIKHSI